MYTVLHMIYAFVNVAFVNVMTLSQVCALRDRIRALSCKTRVHAIYTFLHTVSGACNLYVLAHSVLCMQFIRSCTQCFVHAIYTFLRMKYLCVCGVYRTDPYCTVPYTVAHH